MNEVKSSEFKKVLNKRIGMLLGFNGILLLFLGATSLLGPKGGDISDFIRGFRFGIFIVMQAQIIIYAWRYLAGMKDEKKLKQMYIEENDERTKLIIQKVGRSGFIISIGVLGSATILSGLVNQSVFFTLLAVTVFMLVLNKGLIFYFSKKY